MRRAVAHAILQSKIGKDAANAMTDQERQTVDRLLARIEMAVGQISDRSGPNAQLIKEIIESVNGLRSVVGVIRAH